MLNADQAPYFDTCPRCGLGGLETLKTHAFCVNCNYEEIYSDELCAVPQWALKALLEAKPKLLEQKKAASIKVRRCNSTIAPATQPNDDFDGSAA